MDVRTGFSIVLVGAMTVLVALVVRPFLDYVLAAMLVAFVLLPFQRRLEDEIGRRPAAFALVAATIVAVVVPLGFFLRVALREVPTDLTATAILRPIARTFAATVGVEVDVGALPTNWADRGLAALTERTSALLAWGLHAFLGWLLYLFLLYYLLVDRERLGAWTRRVTPLPPHVQDELYAAATGTTWAVIEGHVLVALVQGFVAGLALFATGVPDAAFWTAVMMVLAIVPIVGVAPVMGGAAGYLLLESRPLAAVLLLAWGLTAVAITDDYLRAKVVDHQSSLHSAVVLLGVFGATYLFGAIGLFVGPILLGVYAATLEVLVEEYDLAVDGSGTAAEGADAGPSEEGGDAA